MVEIAWPAAAALAWAALAFALGGFVKGTLGIGLPLIALPLLSLGWPTTQAIALVAVPVLASNAWQVWDSGISAPGMRRFMPLIVTLLISTLLTVPLTLALPDATLRTILAAVVLLAVALNALPLRLNVPPERERLWSAGVGLLSGVLGGVTSLTGPVIIGYLVSLQLAREVFVGTISVIYVSSALALYGSMAVQGRLGLSDLALSTLALLPMALGLAVGKQVRGHLSELVFRRMLLGFLVAVALVMILK